MELQLRRGKKELMIVFLRKRIMTSWANLHSVSLKKKQEPPIRFFFSSSSTDYASTTLAFLYSMLYCQRSAEAFYVYDSEGYVQPLFKTNPVIHYVKEMPTSGTNLYDELHQVAPVLSPMSYTTLKRTIKALYQLNSETNAKIDLFLSNFGVIRQQYDVGLVLEDPTDVTAAISGLKLLQKRIGKKTLNIFVATNTMDLLRKFAQDGDPSWSYMSMMRNSAPTDKQYKLLKTLAEVSILQKINYLAFRFSTPLGKLLFLTSENVTTESQVVSLDGASWKAL
jgi:hypothetical protein